MTASKEFFGLSGRPFRLEPDTELVFDCRAQREALSKLTEVLGNGSRLTVITGEAGVGKTMLARLLEARIGVPALPVLHLRADDVTAIPRSKLPRSRSRRLLVVIDEAQRLSVEKIGRLTVAAGSPGTHIVLIGRPELLDKLRQEGSPESARALRGAFELKPLTCDEIRPYVEHRLRAVGWNGQRIMSDSARDRLFLATGGLPRQIGRVCARALALAAIDGRDEISGELVADAVNDMTRAPAAAPDSAQNPRMAQLHDRLQALHSALQRERSRGDEARASRDAQRRREAELDVAAAQRLLRWLTRMQQDARQ